MVSELTPALVNASDNEVGEAEATKEFSIELKASEFALETDVITT
jgi:hypothetical protein